MRNANLIADQLHKVGFRTKVITSDCVEVTLTNRKVSQMEVRTAVEQSVNTFGKELQYSNFWNGILVVWNK